ncbi:ATP-grasp domain-containing protein [Elongatibacter sediminis]|uniref:ATP-grasp domain-containing protein n=1 Tax=Elongatibacter sediminis TaxID=3119006 RepID=A0AAW9RP54_9GAMM
MNSRRRNGNGNERLKGRRVLVVNTGSRKKRFTLRRLRELGCRLTILNPAVNWARPYAEHWILADTADHDASLRALAEFLEQNPDSPPEGVITFWEDDVLLASRISDTLGLAGIPYDVARIARDKHLFRAFCRDNDLPAPGHAMIEPGSDLEQAVTDLRFPLVVKPVFGSSSAYVVRVNDLDELAETVDYIHRNISADVETSLSAGTGIMAEEYIDGNEVDIDILLQNGKLKFWSMSDNDATREPFFVETGQCIPSRLAPSQQAELVDMAEEILERLGVRDGCIHFEAKYGSRGPMPIEANLRMGGDEVYDFVRTAWGVDLVESAALIALGEYVRPVQKPETPRKFVSGKYFLPPHSGVLASLTLPEDAGSGDLQFFKRVGDAVLAPPLGYEYLGWAWAVADTLGEAEERTERIMASVKMEVAKFTRGSSLGKTVRKTSLSSAHIARDAVLGAARIELIRTLPSDEQRSLHVGIASNGFADSDNPIEAELTSDANGIAETLGERGYRTSFLDFNRPFDAVRQIEEEKVDIVFNLCERINHTSLLEPHAASLFDILQIPYTGSNPFTLGLCLDKIRVKKLLSFHGIPTPRWDYLYEAEESFSEDFPLPAIVKPANSDSSIGITNDSVVDTREALLRRIDYVLQELKRPALIEEFIDGDEYDVSILGNWADSLRVLPLSRSVFTNLPEGYWHMYPYEAKFLGSEVHRRSIEVQRPPRGVPGKLTSLISEIALDAFNVVGCSDYGRAEVRVDAKGNPYVLEVNPNPSIGPTDCVPSVARLAGLDYGDFLEEILRLAIRRYKDRPPYYHLQMSTL